MRYGNVLLTIGILLAAALLVVALVVDARNGHSESRGADPTQTFYVAEVEAQLALWRDELAQLTAQVEIRGDEELEARIAALGEQLDLADEGLVQIRLDAEGVWQELRQEMDRLLADIGAGLIELRFRLESETGTSLWGRLATA